MNARDVVGLASMVLASACGGPSAETTTRDSAATTFTVQPITPLSPRGIPDSTCNGVRELINRARETNIPMFERGTFPLPEGRGAWDGCHVQFLVSVDTGATWEDIRVADAMRGAGWQDSPKWRLDLGDLQARALTRGADICHLSFVREHPQVFEGSSDPLPAEVNARFAVACTSPIPPDPAPYVDVEGR